MKLSTLIDSLQKELDERGDVIVAIQSEANPTMLVTERLDTVPVTNKHTGRKRLIIIFTIAIGGLDKPDRDTIRDCTIHKEIRDTRYCDGVVYEKGNK